MQPARIDLRDYLIRRDIDEVNDVLRMRGYVVHVNDSPGLQAPIIAAQPILRDVLVSGKQTRCVQWWNHRATRQMIFPLSAVTAHVIDWEVSHPSEWTITTILKEGSSFQVSFTINREMTGSRGRILEGLVFSGQIDHLSSQDEPMSFLYPGVVPIEGRKKCGGSALL